MKKFVLLVVLSLCFTFNVFAKDKDVDKVVAGGQNQQVIKTIFDYQNELGLSNKQIQNLKDKIADFQKYFTEQQKTLVGLQKELKQLFSDNASIRLIRSKLEQISRIQVDVSCRDIETSRNIERELTPAQLKKWKALQLEARKEAKK